LQGAVYHLISRGNARQAVFLKGDFKRKDQKSKDHAMYEAHLQYGYTLKDIAEYIGVHYSTVSRAIKRIEGGDEG
jgi:DNA-binding MarR family transcriptional regulator